MVKPGRGKSGVSTRSGGRSMKKSARTRPASPPSPSSSDPTLRSRSRSRSRSPSQTESLYSDSSPTGSETPLSIEENIDANEGSSKQMKVVHFNDNGQPIGEGSDSFVHYIGSVARKYCPVYYEQWWDVPAHKKEMLWKKVKDEYHLPTTYRKQILQRITKFWRKFKSNLRTEHYDKYNTDEERKRNCPECLSQGDWDKFIDCQSKPVVQARRVRGKYARELMKTPQTTGRRGVAKTAEALKKDNPTATFTRTDLYLASHIRKDGSYPTPQLSNIAEQIKEVVTRDPSSKNLDVDHDPVAQVLGRDKRGIVRGLGDGVSRTAVLASAHVRDQLQEERKKVIAAQEQIASQSQTIADLKMQLAAKRLTDLRTHTPQVLHKQFSTDFATSHVRTTLDVQSPPDLQSPLVEQQPCELLGFGNVVVATGRALNRGSFNDDSNQQLADVFSIILDAVHDADAHLFRPGKASSVLRGIEVGAVITWPANFTRFIFQVEQKPCELLAFDGVVVATGRALRGSSFGHSSNQPTADEFSVIVDIVHDADAHLFRPNKSSSILGDVDVGTVITWPANFTRFLCPVEQQPCKLLAFGDVVVASGRALKGSSSSGGNNQPSSGVLSVIIDVVHDGDARLFKPNKSSSILRDVEIGTIITWPTFFTCIQ